MSYYQVIRTRFTRLTIADRDMQFGRVMETETTRSRSGAAVVYAAWSLLPDVQQGHESVRIIER